MTAGFTELPGLPAEGPLPKQYSASGRGTHREGLVVRFYPVDGPAWVGNFQRGEGDCDIVLRQFKSSNLIVIASGQAYEVDPQSGELIDMFEIESHFWVDVPSINTFVMTNGCWFEAYSTAGSLWRTRPVSADTVRHVRIGESSLWGEGYTADATWEPFCIDLATGRVKGD